jgi:hypothetical protein
MDSTETVEPASEPAAVVVSPESSSPPPHAARPAAIAEMARSTASKRVLPSIEIPTFAVGV